MIKLTPEDILHLYTTGNLQSFILSGKAAPTDIINTLCERSLKQQDIAEELQEKVERLITYSH